MFLHKKLFHGYPDRVPRVRGAIRVAQSYGAVVTVATFDPAQSQLPEGIAIDKEGNIYVGFYPTGQILKMTPHGEQSIFATLDVSGSVGGGLVGFVLDEEGNLYVCDASGEPATHGIWKVERSGARRLIAALDPTGFPNALVFDQEGNLFVTDSYLGEIWKISKSGQAKVWLKDPLLASVFAYGANGKFDRGYLFVVNSDQGTIVPIERGGIHRLACHMSAVRVSRPSGFHGTPPLPTLPRVDRQQDTGGRLSTATSFGLTSVALAGRSIQLATGTTCLR